MIFKKKPQRRSAGIYSRDGKLFIYPHFITTTGISLGGEPIAVMEQIATDSEVGREAREALRRHRTGHPHPVRFDNPSDPLLEAAGVKTWATFAKGALACSISEDGVEVVITPSRRGKARASYLFTPDLNVKVNLPASDEQVGAAIREALARCE